MFIPTRAAGLDALDEFVPRAGRDYARDRNADLGASRDNVSGLSPYVRHRLVTEHEVVAAVLDRHSLPAAEKFVQEVFWRTYWKGWLEQNPEVWRRYRREVDEFATGTLPTGYEDAVHGRTGIDAMDAWARELIDTGYLHNHTRMWFASIWVFTLGLPWQLGADFFHRHLLDGDAASNTLSWRWVAGLQTAWQDLPGDGVEHRAVHGRAVLADRTRDDGPGARRGAAATTHTDRVRRRRGHDRRPGRSAAARGGPRAIEPARRAPPADRARWRQRSSRTPAHGPRSRSRTSSRPSRPPPSTTPPDRTPDASGRPAQVLADTLPSTVLRWAESEQLDTVVVPYAPVGPVHERLAVLRPALAAEGVALVTVRRRWDSASWPFASRGFFPFRERIPALVRQLVVG